MVADVDAIHDHQRGFVAVVLGDDKLANVCSQMIIGPVAPAHPTDETSLRADKLSEAAILSHRT